VLVMGNKEMHLSVIQGGAIEKGKCWEMSNTIVKLEEEKFKTQFHGGYKGPWKWWRECEPFCANWWT
jgi:hypothetical protein